MRCKCGVDEAAKQKGTNREVTSTQARSPKDRQDVQAGPQGPPIELTQEENISGRNSRAPWLHQPRHLCVIPAWAVNSKAQVILARAGKLKKLHKSKWREGAREAYRVCPRSASIKCSSKAGVQVQFPSSLSSPLLSSNKQIASTPPGQRTQNVWSQS